MKCSVIDKMRVKSEHTHTHTHIQACIHSTKGNNPTIELDSILMNREKKKKKKKKKK